MLHLGEDADGQTGLIGLQDASLFKLAMRRHAAGVCIISTGTGQDVNGMAVTAATSFSADPPAMLVCVNQAASIRPTLVRGTPFCLTILGQHHAEIAQAFPRKPGGRARFEHGAWLLRPKQLPWLEDAPANLLCRNKEPLGFGSNAAFVGLVQNVKLGPDVESLVYRDGTYA